MSRYYFEFFGRRTGDIGLDYKIKTDVTASDYDAAVLALYEKGYEHIHVIRWSAVKID